MSPRLSPHRKAEKRWGHPLTGSEKERRRRRGWKAVSGPSDERPYKAHWPRPARRPWWLGLPSPVSSPLRSVSPGRVPPAIELRGGAVNAPTHCPAIPREAAPNDVGSPTPLTPSLPFQLKQTTPLLHLSRKPPPTPPLDPPTPLHPPPPTTSLSPSSPLHLIPSLFPL